ncbi:hypothetical protein RhiJN_03420 [Ceratobasidium sp. AG-Ba]|nr:hypothetical protein RhiJN_03420 [Ceratobasidium sp. AG-Ba]QRW04312.1 hypothetical protein RhiLY_03311 [Ceratobasidium sp. AG-Ba]
MAAALLPSDLYRKLFERDPTTVPLSPKRVYDSELTAQIKHLKLPDGSTPPDPLLASLYLLNDDIKSAHSIAEPMYDKGIYDCDYQHGLVHIRDADWWNAQWWFRRIARTNAPLLIKNYPEASSADAAGRAAENFIKECERVGNGTSSDHKLESNLYMQMKEAAEWSAQVFVTNK